MSEKVWIAMFDHTTILRILKQWIMKLMCLNIPSFTMFIMNYKCLQSRNNNMLNSNKLSN